MSVTEKQFESLEKRLIAKFNAIAEEIGKLYAEVEELKARPIVAAAPVRPERKSIDIRRSCGDIESIGVDEQRGMPTKAREKLEGSLCSRCQTRKEQAARKKVAELQAEGMEVDEAAMTTRG